MPVSGKTKAAAGSFAIECRNLTKKFGSFTAVDNIELHVRKGELFGFLGPNGAGKTTTIRMLTTLISPTSGTASVAGFDVHSEGAGVRSRIGVVPQQFSLFEELTAVENLWYIGRLFGMRESEIEKRSGELLKIVSLFDKRDIPSGTYSGGMKQRLSVAAGLLHTPEILFMDEPTTGLDPQSRISLRDLTKELNRQGITIVYTTHDMFEADQLCERIAIMDHGRIIALGTPEELKEKHGKGFVIELDLAGITDGLALELQQLVGATRREQQENSLHLHIPALSEGLIEKISAFLAKKNVPLKALRISESTLEEVFINLTKKDLRD